jgi:hypothetical protein
MHNHITFIYTLADPLTGDVRYIGKAFDLPGRLRGHLKEIGSTYKCNWIKTLKAEGKIPIIEALETLVDATDKEWQEAERFWIESLKHLGCRLTNADAGGIGGGRRSQEVKDKISAKHKGKILSPEHRKKLSLARLNASPEQKEKWTQIIKSFRPSAEAQKRAGLSRRGLKRSPEAIKKFIRSVTGLKRTSEQRARMSEAFKGRIASPETRLKMSIAQSKRIHPKEFGEAISRGKMGHLVSQETRDKIASTVRLRWENGTYANRITGNRFTNNQQSTFATQTNETI